MCRIYRMTDRSQHIEREEPEGILLLNYLEGTASEEEKKCVEDWLGDNKDNEKIFLQTARLFYAVRTQQRIASRNPLAAYEKVQERIRKRIRKIWLTRTYVVAACFVGVLVVSTVIASLMKKADVSESQIITIQANAGMRMHFNLPDGTVAYLNSGTTLSYPFPYKENERRVALSGEAYFKVIHDPNKPFVVSVCDERMEVKVLGTEFNLQAYKGEEIVQTTLVKGAVSLKMKNGDGKAFERELLPSEKAVYNMLTGYVHIGSVNTECETGWMEGRLIFKDLPLPQVLKKLSYFYNVKFEVTDPVINSYSFTGTFENKQLSQVLDYLKISSRIEYEIRQVKTDDSNGVKYTTVRLRKRN